MAPTRTRRHRPVYPLIAAVALGGALVSGCGVGVEEPTAQDRQQIQQADAGTQQPQPPEFMGGGAPYEAFDGGR